MAEETVIKSDLNFVKRLQEAGGESLKKCYQCATCSVVCNISPDDKPYPRKEMIMAQWGMKEDIVKDPDIWLCHYCGDCTTYCPRGANPGEVLGAMRQVCIEHYSTPSFLARMVNQKMFLPFLIAFPMVVILAVLSMLGTLKIPEGPIQYSKMIPPFPWVDLIFMGAAGWAVFVFFNGVRRYWADLNAGASPWKAKLSGQSLTTALSEVISEIFAHTQFKKCVANLPRSTSHLMVFLGFVALFITTGWSAFYEWAPKLGLMGHYESPYPFSDPIKWLALAGTVMLLYGIIRIFQERQAKAAEAGFGSYFDWLFIWVIVAVAATGALSWLLRLLGMATLAYPTYFLHLVSVFFLFFYAPYSKMAHMVYRTTAMLYARMAKRGF
jgi:quinone-modifying oxidoreductase subunit QmoC